MVGNVAVVAASVLETLWLCWCGYNTLKNGVAETSRTQFNEEYIPMQRFSHKLHYIAAANL